MRTRKDIEKEIDEINKDPDIDAEGGLYGMSVIQTEVLLDIRDLLIGIRKNTQPTTEYYLKR